MSWKPNPPDPRIRGFSIPAILAVVVISILFLGLVWGCTTVCTVNDKLAGYC